MHINTMTWSSDPNTGHDRDTNSTSTSRSNGFGASGEGWNVAGRRLDPEPQRFSSPAVIPTTISRLARYAQSKGVKLIVHNERPAESKL